MLSLHRMCEHPVKMLTMQINQLRELLYEFGVDLPQGRKKRMAMVVEKLARLDGRLSAMVIVLIRQQIRRIQVLDQDITGIENNLLLWKKEDATSRKLMDIPGVGILTATKL